MKDQNLKQRHLRASHTQYDYTTIASVTVKSKIHFLFFFSLQKTFSRGGMEGTSKKENLLMREIEDHPVVSSLCFICAIGRDKAGYRANLRCGCEQVGSVRMSSKRPTLQDCLRELGRLIQQDHGPTCVAAAQKLQAVEKDAADASTKRSHDEGPVSLNTNQVLMLHSRLKIIQARAAQANKAVLETEKERDELHTQIEEIEEQLQPKRAHSDVDAGDAHEIPAEVDNWDLRDHRREGTRVQNRRNVQVGSRDNQQKPCPGKDGLGSHSSGQHLLVTGCKRTKQTAWIEDQFTVTSSAGIRNREKRVADIVVRELKRAKPGVWG